MNRLAAIGLSGEEIKDVRKLIIEGKVKPETFEHFDDVTLAATLREEFKVSWFNMLSIRLFLTCFVSVGFGIFSS